MAPLDVQFETAADLPALIEVVFDAATHLARRTGDGFQVELSTNPFAEGSRLDLDAFEPAAPGSLRQSLDGGRLTRRWRIDTLLPYQPATATEVSEMGQAWLAAERDRLPGLSSAG